MLCAHFGGMGLRQTLMGCGLQMFGSGQDQVASVPGSGQSDL